MYKKRLKSIIFNDPITGKREIHSLDKRGLPKEGIQRSKKKNVKTRKPVINIPIMFDPMLNQQQASTYSLMNQPQFLYQNQEKSQIDLLRQIQAQIQLSLSSKNSTQDPQQSTLVNLTPSNFRKNEEEFPELNLASILDDDLESFYSDFCQSSTDISMLSCNDDYSDIFEVVTPLHEY